MKLYLYTKKNICMFCFCFLFCFIFFQGEKQLWIYRNLYNSRILFLLENTESWWVTLCLNWSRSIKWVRVKGWSCRPICLYIKGAPTHWIELCFTLLFHHFNLLTCKKKTKTYKQIEKVTYKARQEGLVGWKPGLNLHKHIHTYDIYKTLYSYPLNIKLHVKLTL